MADDLNAVAEKKLKSRITKFKKVIKSDDEKVKFFEQLGMSVEVFLPTKDPENGDSIIFYTTADGNVMDAEYSYMEGEAEPISLPIEDKNLKILVEAFSDDFKLKFDE
ncbi:hypothetical protein [Methanobrevibacter sp. DSM 116169]|uniref:hypothetical protein n=1 Tax=Methanobrevibacter sp. DSM 116169 TaxID=3242727 RepID=UPI0038FD23F7